MNDGSSGSRPPRRRFWWWAAIAGIVSAGAFLAVAELIALAVARDGSPILAVGSFVIDIVPQPFKEFAIATFGENDKPVLLASLGLAVVIAAALAGVLQLLRPPLGVITMGIAGALSVAAIVTRAGATPLAFVPPVVGSVVGSILLVVLVRRLRAWREAVAAPAAAPAASAPSTPADPADPADPAQRRPAPGVDRRAFFRIAAISAASALVVGVGARIATATTSSIAAIRRALKLPAPRSTVVIPAGAELDIPGISPLVTPNADFYRVDTALVVPSVDPAAWRLTIDGMVDRRIELSFDDLVNMGLDEYAVTLTCVSNEVGGELLGNAIWLGVPVREVLRLASPTSGADMVLSRSVDGFTASTPLESLTDDGLDAILAVGMNGEPLPLEHGFPVRMVVPGLYGYVSATKWLTELKVTRFDADEAYWTPRGYSAKAPIKLSSRIDTPRIVTAVTAGPTTIAGVAWAQPVGIEQVEVRVDDGAWQQATLATPISGNTWVQWFLEWQATAGTHYLTVRATDKDGTLQTEELAPIAPDGSSGWQRLLIRVS
ncbi:molybdopterin-dependent oxidoreductase [Agromyces subbeticus]|uniref:molybdopterin-dependent oxidoreductase n=1 Tax=Agromyces subbeticus TaxID=293890 RepID=UPI0003B72A65|nr:molybdopterin-dependent oxidoreductase [Agromyces subbeticus]